MVELSAMPYYTVGSLIFIPLTDTMIWCLISIFVMNYISHVWPQVVELYSNCALGVPVMVWQLAKGRQAYGSRKMCIMTGKNKKKRWELKKKCLSALSSF